MHIDGMMTKKEAAEYIRFSVSSLNQWLKKGIGPRVTRIAGRVFYMKDDLDSWVDSHREKDGDA